MDIVFGTDGENLWLIYDDLTVADGFPVSAGGDFRTAPAVLDLNGEKIILAGSRDNSFYGVNSDGSIRFQVETGDDINTSAGFVDTGNEIGIVIQLQITSTVQYIQMFALGCGDYFQFIIIVNITNSWRTPDLVPRIKTAQLFTRNM